MLYLLMIRMLLTLKSFLIKAGRRPIYFRITTRCNMLCEHCSESCTEEGEDMHFDTFKKIIADEEPYMISLGGGEPTIHPDFEKFVMYALSHVGAMGDGGVWLATNGKESERAIMCARLAMSHELFSCQLSRDTYHEEASLEVLDAFKAMGRSQAAIRFHQDIPVSTIESIAFRNNDDRIMKQGRAEENGIWHVSDSCICPERVAMPNGDIRWCGCTDSPVINDGDEFEDLYADSRENDVDCYTYYTKERPELFKEAV